MRAIKAMAFGCLLLSGCSTNDPLPAPVTGTVRITVIPAGQALPWVMAGPSRSYSGTGDSTLADMETGSYSIEWRDHPRWLAPRGRAAPQTLALGASIAFSAQYDSTVQLTDDPGSDTGPDWAPLPTAQLAFESDRHGASDIYTLSVDDLSTRRITFSGATAPSWSRDASEIVYRSNAEYGNIDVVRLSDLTVRSVAFGPYLDSAPDWSPASDCVVFCSDSRLADQSVHVVAGSGGTVSTLISRTQSTVSVRDIGPNWNPTATRIAFHSNRKLGGGPHYGIYVMYVVRPGDCSTCLVTGAEEITDEPAASHSQPSWSPDGRWIAYTRTEANNDIWIVRVSDKRTFRFTFWATDEDSPAWSPEGNAIAYSSTQTGNREIWLKVFDESAYP